MNQVCFITDTFKSTATGVCKHETQVRVVKVGLIYRSVLEIVL